MMYFRDNTFRSFPPSLSGMLFSISELSPGVHVLSITILPDVSLPAVIDRAIVGDANLYGHIHLFGCHQLTFLQEHWINVSIYGRLLGLQVPISIKKCG